MPATKTRKSSRRRQLSPAELEQYRAEKRARADGILAEVVDMFETGELPQLVAQTMIARAEGAPIGRWSVLNQLQAIRNGTTDARGFRQWQEVGRQVRKGCHAFYILGPRTIKERDDASGEDKTRVVGFVPIPVFRLQDTDGEELGYTPAPVNLPPLFDVAERLGVNVTYQPANAAAGMRGFYAPGQHEIVLLTQDVRTFFHELAHAAHDKVTPGGIETVEPAAAEIVAETTAATLCHLYGFDGYLYHGAQYVERFAGGNPGRAAAHVLGDVQKVLYLILDPVE